MSLFAKKSARVRSSMLHRAAMTLLERLEGRTLLAADVPSDLVVSIPTHAWEGQTIANAGAVQIGAALTEPLVVALVSSDASELGVPATVTIPAGEMLATFTLKLPVDGLKDGA